MFRRRDVFAVVAIISVLGGLVVAGPAQAAATGEWVGTVRVTLTRMAVGPNFEGHGPDLTYEVTDQTVNSVTFSAGSHLEFGALLECTEDSSTVMTSHEGGSILVGLADPLTLLVQAQLDGYETLTTQVFTGPPESCSNAVVETPNTFQVTVRNTNVTLIDVDQEAVSGSVVLLDSSNEGDSRFEKIDYAVHRDCTGFDADRDGVGDCQELDNGTDPSIGDPQVQPCDGISKEDVIGPDPALAASRPALALFPNDDAICEGLWVPTLDDGFIPQGLALLGDGTALVSGYLDMPGPTTMRIVHVDLSNGALVGTERDLVAGGHGGGIEIDENGRVWVASTRKLWSWPSMQAVFSAEAPRWVQAGAGYDFSYFAEANGPNLWVGSFGTNEILQFPLSTVMPRLMADRLKLKKLVEAEATTRVTTGAETQGGVFHDPNLWTASSVTADSTVRRSHCGTLNIGLLTRTRYGFAPGIEEISFDDAGFLWMVSEAGSSKYPPQFFPVIAKADTSKVVDEPVDPLDDRCRVGL